MLLTCCKMASRFYLLNSLFRIGLRKDQPNELKQRIWISNLAALIQTIGVLPFSIYLIQNQAFSLLWLILISVSGSLMVFVFHRIGRSFVARVWFLAFFHLCTYAFVFFMGSQIQLQYLFLLLILAPPILFDQRQERTLVVSFQLLAGLVYLLILFDYFPHSDHFQFSDSSSYFLNIYLDVVLAIIAFQLIRLVYVNLFWQINFLKTARQDAESANVAKSRFLSNMSHEIRTPLNAVIGLTELLESTALDQEQEEYTRIIKVSSESLLSVVSDILDYSKIEAGSLELEEISFTLEPMVDQVIDMLSIRAGKRGLDLTYQIDKNVPPQLIGDETRLRQILINLIGNGIKFTFEGGVMMRISSLGKHKGKQGLKFAIQDTGIGIPQDRIDLLFQPFAQVDASTTREFGGTGLGLAISGELVRMMDGRVWVDSVADVGSTFFFEVWFKDAEDAPVPAKEARPATLVVEAPPHKPLFNGSLAILLVEDNATNQKVILRMMAKLGMSVDVVENGAEAVKACEQNTYDLILMDLQMPIMDGFEATRRIRALPGMSDQNPVIVAVTANSFKDDRDHAQEAGMNDFIAKPVRSADLIQVLSQWFPPFSRLEPHYRKLRFVTFFQRFVH